MGKIKASREGIKQINSDREAKGWTKDQNSEALIITSQQEFKKAVDEILLTQSVDNTLLTIEQLEKLADFFTTNAKNAVFKCISKLLKEKTQKITIAHFLQIIESEDLHTKGITYINWQKFLQGKEIDKPVFIAFCDALEIEDWRDVAEARPIDSKDNTKQARLVEGLSLFNHQKQVNLLLEKLANGNRAFLVANPCHYSRTWMLRRLESEISANIKLKCKPISLQRSLYSSLGIGELKAHFEEKYLPTKIINILKQEHIVIVFDIDSYDLQRLEQLIVEFWQPLVSNLPPKTPGMLLMFLLATNRGNDWQGKWQNNPTLCKHMTELLPANPFQPEDVAQVLPKVALQLRKPLSEPALDIAHSLIQKSQGKTDKLLQEIYRYFECRTTEFSVWQRYPHF
ncbi:hypothetical protein [Scytonema sp. PRP1]|uniref:hypothetical protein n=1 Tax=Scytonema sp. PRP1 TaxID=3120513 RepID=UPI002FD09FE9